MKILLLCTAYNGLCQRVHEELESDAHTVAVELAISDVSMLKAVESFEPDLILCPFLKQKVPEFIWQNYTCVIIHPGIVGDRGPSSLDWAIHERCERWGVTALQASAEMDAGDIWATREFAMRSGAKASLYRQEVTDAAVECIQETIRNFEDASFRPRPLDYRNSEVKGRLRPAMVQADRAIDWKSASTDDIVLRINAADSFPGLRDVSFGRPLFLYGAHREFEITGQPGQLIARRDGAICRATTDGAVWITHMRDPNARVPVKLPATQVLQADLSGIPERALPCLSAPRGTYQEIRYEEHAGAGYIFFDFHNGAMDTDQCIRLREVYLAATARPTRVIALMGGNDFWSNGIHLNAIEAARDPAEEGWRNINAMNDLVQAIITTGSHLVVSALRSNAGAGGAILPLSAHYVIMRDGVILNPHYKSMGLFGSEYWTYLLPRRVGAKAARELTSACLPVGAQRASELKLVDQVWPSSRVTFDRLFRQYCEELAAMDDFEVLLNSHNEKRALDESRKSLSIYREEELKQMKLNFYSDNWQFAAKRHDFVYKTCAKATPEHLVSRGRGTAVPAATEPQVSMSSRHAAIAP